ncbi:hypothetical protein CPB85DRAFT_1453856 [Mucidula mucida]|nr:hypothetical protein CPB85DRAFT_1453856 [Mucidula mucida]
MPPRMLLLKVHATYTAPKAEICSESTLAQATRMLLQDLDALDFMRPKYSSIKVVRPSVIEFGLWETDVYSGEKFRRSELPTGRRVSQVTGSELRRLGMVSLELFESFVSSARELREEPSTMNNEYSTPTMSPRRRYRSTTISTSRSRSRSRSRSPARRSQIVSHLLQELADTRQRIKELASDETLLHSGLPFEPDEPDMIPEVFLMQSQLRSAKMEAEKEREIKAECENALEEIKRDGRVPFSSPLVLELFLLEDILFVGGENMTSRKSRDSCKKYLSVFKEPTIRRTSKGDQDIQNACPGLLVYSMQDQKQDMAKVLLYRDVVVAVQYRFVALTIVRQMGQRTKSAPLDGSELHERED